MKIMEGIVHVLDEVVANKIAAGEVVERPSAVVKELVENAIDADSTKIKIDIEESGSKLIRVSDNGWGMVKRDALLSLERHATSKIREADDLFHITTLGFRGEALPSIAAVSTLELTTRVENQLEGTYIQVVGGEIKEVKEIGCPVGTTISVRNLFYNTPARLKYLKSAATEMGHILDIVNHLSLAHPDISFQLTHNGKAVLFTTGSSSLQEVILNIYGKQVAKEMIPVSAANQDIQLKGLIGKPSVARGSRSHMIFFVNGRFIRSRIIGRAVEDAYKTLLPIRKYPLVILNLEINPQEIDVNVHPTKTEIRFADERQLYLLVYQGVSQGLKSTQLIPQVETLEEPIKKEERKIEYIPQTLPIAVPFQQPALEIPKKEETIKIEQPRGLSPRVEHPIFVRENQPVAPYLPVKLPDLSILGQVHATYIVAEGNNGLYILDQHAAHERILYEKIKAARQTREVDVQSLLIPILLELTPKERAIWPDIQRILQETGFEIDDFGGDSYLVRGIPTFLEDKNVLPLIREIIDDFCKTERERQTSDWQERAMITMACRLAIKAGDSLERKEMEELINMLDQTSNPYTCPHGRPTLLDFSLDKLAENFKRR